MTNITLPEYGAPVTFSRDGYDITLSLDYDQTGETPWENCDGTGPVSNWRDKLTKRPGEIVLCRDGINARFYDMQAACRIARRDSWGLSPYKLIFDHGANGLTKATAHYFDASNNLLCYSSDWCDDINNAIAQVYDAHRATMTPREYAALAARADYDRLAAWCDDRWHYCGVVATVTRAGITLATASLWGIESDSDAAYFAEIAADLTDEALTQAQAAIAALTE